MKKSNNVESALETMNQFAWKYKNTPDELKAATVLMSFCRGECNHIFSNGCCELCGELEQLNEKV